MNNREKRNLALACVIGDGCLHKAGSSSALTIEHGISQLDYITWKAKLLGEAFDRTINVRLSRGGKAAQISVCSVRLRSWRKFIYKDNVKTTSRILRFITDPIFATAIWLMDDGYVESSISTLATGEKVNYGARFRIFTCNEPDDQQQKIIQWFTKSLDITPVLKKTYVKKKKVTYPFLKINGEDSLKLWSKIREVILQFESMKYKFRYIEQIYQKRIATAHSPVDLG